MKSNVKEDGTMYDPSGQRESETLEAVVLEELTTKQSGLDSCGKNRGCGMGTNAYDIRVLFGNQTAKYLRLLHFTE